MPSAQQKPSFLMRAVARVFVEETGNTSRYDVLNGLNNLFQGRILPDRPMAHTQIVNADTGGEEMGIAVSPGKLHPGIVDIDNGPFRIQHGNV
jgi:hypothetical protein